MKCPLLSISITREDRIQGYQELDCLKEECAWWVDTEKECSITILALEASYKLWDRDRPKGYKGG